MSHFKSIIAIMLICVLLFPIMNGSANMNVADCTQLLTVNVPDSGVNGRKKITTDNVKPIELLYDVTPNQAAATRRDPIDLVLIAETAETMAQDFDGNELGIKSSDPNQRINAMKNSLKQFVTLVTNSNLKKTNKDRVALIKFDSVAETKSEFTENYSDLLTKIDSLTPVDPKDDNKVGKNFGKAFSVASQMIRNTQKNIPVAPKEINFTNMSSNKVTLTWNSTLDASLLKHYELYRSKDSLFNFTKIVETTEPFFTDESLVSASTYDYYVITVDKSGVKSNQSPVRRMTTKADTTPPTAPGFLKANQVDSSSATLSWSASLDNSGIRSYQIYVNGSLYASTSTPTYQLDDLKANTPYVVSVRAVDLLGLTSGNSNIVNFSTLNKKKISLYYKYPGFSIPEIKHRDSLSTEWITNKMNISEVFGLYKKELEIDTNKSLYTQFKYIDNRANFYPNFYESFQPRRKKFDLFDNPVKIIGSNPKPLQIVDDNAPFALKALPLTSHFFNNRAEGSGTFYAGINSLVTEPLDKHVDEVVKMNVNPLTQKTIVSNTVTIYYKSGGPIDKPKLQPFTSPFIHFSLDGKNWTNEPGLKMKPSKIAGYHYITIDLGEGNKLSKMAFNNGKQDSSLREWQNNNGNDFFNKVTDSVMVYDPTTDTLRADNPNSHNIAVVYYKSNRYMNSAKSTFFQTPHLHYNLDGTMWTKAPGLRMNPSLIAGYHYISIDLGSQNTIDKLAFSDGAATYDNENGNNFKNKIKAGINLYDPETNTIVEKSPFQFIQNQNVARIYYKSDEIHALSGMAALANPHVHYDLDGSKWTTLPGIPLVPSSVTGYHTAIIPLGNKEKVVQTAFTDGNGNWQNNGGKNFVVPKNDSVYYPISSTFSTGTPREVVGRKINQTEMIEGETKIATIYYNSGAVHGIDNPYIHYELDGVWTKAPGEKMYPSELKGYHKISLPLVNLNRLKAVFTDSKQSVWQKAGGNSMEFADGMSTYTPTSSTDGKMLPSKPSQYEPDDRRKVVIFLSDGLPNIDPATGKLESNGSSSLIFGQYRENPFTNRIGYKYARDELNQLVSTGTQVHVIAIGSDNAVNIDSAAIDLNFLEYIATVGNGNFLRAEDAEQFRINLEGIGNQLATEKLTDVKLQQQLPSGFSLLGGTNIADAEVNGEVYPNSVTLNGGLLSIELNEIPLSGENSYRVKVNVLANEGGVFTLSPVKLTFPYMDMNCTLNAKESYDLDVAAVRYDMYGNKYVGTTDGRLHRFSLSGMSGGYPATSLQWTIDPFAGDGAKYPVKSIQFVNDDTMVQAVHHNTSTITTWDLLPAPPTSVTFLTSDNKFLTMSPSNKFISNVLPTVRIMNTSGAGLKTPLSGTTPISPSNISIYRDFDDKYTKGYEYSMNGGKSWLPWLGGNGVVIPTEYTLQTLMFRGYTDAVSGVAKTGDEFTGTFKYSLANKPPVISINPPQQNELLINGTKFANKTDDLSVQINMIDDNPINNDFKVEVDGKIVNLSLMKVENLSDGLAKKITLQWSKLFPDAKVRQGDKKITVLYEDDGGLKDSKELSVNLNVGPYVSATNVSEIANKVHNRPVTVRFNWLSMIPNMKLTAPEYQIINRPVTFTGTPPEPVANQWKKLGSKAISVSSAGVNFIYVRVRDSKNVTSMENGYSTLNKRTPVRVRINYGINQH